MSTYGEAYDEMINECSGFNPDDLPSWVTGGKTSAELMKQNDPVMYRCGFSDWLDSIDEGQFLCGTCNEPILREWIINECDEDDDIECPVCAGSHGKCETCGEYKEVHEMWENDRLGDECKVCHRNSA